MFDAFVLGKTFLGDDNENIDNDLYVLHDINSFQDEILNANIFQPLT